MYTIYSLLHKKYIPWICQRDQYWVLFVHFDQLLPPRNGNQVRIQPSIARLFHSAKHRFNQHFYLPRLLGQSLWNPSPAQQANPEIIYGFQTGKIISVPLLANSLVHLLFFGKERGDANESFKQVGPNDDSGHVLVYNIFASTSVLLLRKVYHELLLQESDLQGYSEGITWFPASVGQLSAPSDKSRRRHKVQLDWLWGKEKDWTHLRI